MKNRQSPSHSMVKRWAHSLGCSPVSPHTELPTCHSTEQERTKIGKKQNFIADAESCGSRWTRCGCNDSGKVTGHKAACRQTPEVCVCTRGERLASEILSKGKSQQRNNPKTLRNTCNQRRSGFLLENYRIRGKKQMKALKRQHSPPCQSKW